METVIYCQECADSCKEIERLEDRIRLLEKALHTSNAYLGKVCADGLLQDCVVRPQKAFNWCHAILHRETLLSIQEFEIDQYIDVTPLD